MADPSSPLVEVQTVHTENPSSTGKWILLAVAVVYVAASTYFLADLSGRVKKLDQDQMTSAGQVADLTKRMESSEADSEALAKQLGMTKKELAERSDELKRQQAAQASAEQKLAAEQKKQAGQISDVDGQVASVKTDVGGVKSDLTTTRSDLAATNAKLQSTIGDLGVQSGLIANTRSDLEVLKHKGDRNYYEFTLQKGAKPQAVSTVSLQLKKTDEKRGKFTLNVTADDKTIEKKDRNVSEPIQFYTGRDHMLYELVVWTVSKKQITGYLSTPKNAPTPVTASQGAP